MQYGTNERSTFPVEVLDLQAEAFSSASPSVGTVVGAGAPPFVGLQNFTSCYSSLDRAG